MVKQKFKKSLIAFTLVPMLMGTTIVIYPSTEVKATTQVNQTKRNVMYYGDWSIWGGQETFYPKDIPAKQLTHLNFAFLDFNADGSLKFTDAQASLGAPVGMPEVQWNSANAGLINAFQELRAENPNLKIGISLGGWSKSGDFSTVAANSSTRAKFVENVMKFIDYANMDFVDIDWEYPGSVREPDLIDNERDEGTKYSTPEDKQNYVLLLQDFRKALNEQGPKVGKSYELSVAIPAPKKRLDAGIDIKKVFETVDFANIMTYDMRGAWDDTSGHQTGLYPNPNDPTKGAGLSIDESVKYLLSNGATANKVVVGAAYYTRGWQKVSKGPDSKTPGLYGTAEQVTKDADGTPARGATNEAPLKPGDGGRIGGVWAYRSLNKLKATFPGLKEYWDDTAKAPYLYDENGGAFFTYDNPRSIAEKTKYVNENNLGGMIGWMSSQDAPTSTSVRDELTNATKNGLYSSAELPKHDIVYKNLNVTAKVTPYAEGWGTGGGYQVTITNNEKLQESGEVLSGVEKAAETIKTPKLYIKSTDGPLQSGEYTAGTVSYENGYTVVDISTVYEAKTLEPGKTYSFKLKTSTAPKDISAIQSIELSQRIHKGAVEIARQNIFGTTNPNENSAPSISGVANKTINVGDSFNPLEGVTASDREDGDLTSKISITGSVNTNIVGTYTLKYSVTDSKGLSTTADRIITVTKSEIPNTAPTISGATNKTINIGENFDPKSGVTATDKEDGILTNKIVITGSVNNNLAGDYTLTYSVTDSKGLSTTVTRIITVKNTAPSTDAWTVGKTYKAGDIVSYNGKSYKCLQPHTALLGWDPASVPSLWQQL
ncbi:chitinase family 18 [Clostridium cavendishii DSM 21758]|uniref:chitinase n=1 Tax=Clostridium cavendishii DSM 21758 TaxID=1121302 RepID=A0A1M6V7S3_9CLOT|nr:glycosyl hydrolase family 18 protein [Clostridium cavendishii]SHK77386.1 chitinase family 18 [Clostridium cavendishii DSM 21758]